MTGDFWTTVLSGGLGGLGTALVLWLTRRARDALARRRLDAGRLHADLQARLDARAQAHQAARRSGRLGAREQTAAVFEQLAAAEQREHDAA